jgi:hypothetical protein
MESHIMGKSNELVIYFFSGKYEKQVYIDFLKTLLIFASQNPKYLFLCDEIHEDI